MSDSFWDGLFDGGDGPWRDDPEGAGGVLLDVIAAVDHLRRGQRHGLTFWDALEEAVRWWAAENESAIAGVIDPEAAALAWGVRDPLSSALVRLVEDADASGLTVEVAVQQALRRWAETMASQFNDGHPWPHPTARRPFPAVPVDFDLVDHKDDEP